MLPKILRNLAKPVDFPYTTHKPRHLSAHGRTYGPFRPSVPIVPKKHNKIQDKRPPRARTWTPKTGREAQKGKARSKRYEKNRHLSQRHSDSHRKIAERRPPGTPRSPKGPRKRRPPIRNPRRVRRTLRDRSPKTRKSGQVNGPRSARARMCVYARGSDPDLDQDQ
ncbi:hypothetical protein FUAX_53410 (plasmid) [Fulvitalea axinellae]|uniref:Uncharacterized protein n=1 Tax=Fulvitalea axinellae TaxID=1182444 RepID=A0AAU9D2V3_9BACT|nr:hypothetical protein FUAX_53410 [Fulvitalea axinellae]